jgi:hypothetical protein
MHVWQYADRSLLPATDARARATTGVFHVCPYHHVTDVIASPARYIIGHPGQSISLTVVFAGVATMDVKRKYEIEAALATEAEQISAGKLKEDNPLDLSDNFRIFCEACRRGDLKFCQEMISAGVNINARDKFDYTPLILVSGPLGASDRHFW